MSIPGRGLLPGTTQLPCCGRPYRESSGRVGALKPEGSSVLFARGGSFAYSGAIQSGRPPGPAPSSFYGTGRRSGRASTLRRFSLRELTTPGKWPVTRLPRSPLQATRTRWHRSHRRKTMAPVRGGLRSGGDGPVVQYNEEGATVDWSPPFRGIAETSGACVT